MAGTRSGSYICNQRWTRRGHTISAATIVRPSPRSVGHGSGRGCLEASIQSRLTTRGGFSKESASIQQGRIGERVTYLARHSLRVSLKASDARLPYPRQSRNHQDQKRQHPLPTALVISIGTLSQPPAPVWEEVYRWDEVEWGREGYDELDVVYH